MILEQEQHLAENPDQQYQQQYVGKSIAEIQLLEGVGSALHTITWTTLAKAEKELIERGRTGSLIDHLVEQYQETLSLDKVRKGFGLRVNVTVLPRLFDILGIPRLSQAEAARHALNKLREDSEFKRNHAEATRKHLSKLWEDLSFRDRAAENMRTVNVTLRNDPDFVERLTEAQRKVRLGQGKDGQFHLPTLHGYRSDIDFHAKSLWEANFARVSLHLGRTFYPHYTFKLNVTEEYRGLFNADQTETDIDFVTIDPRGNTVLYEIMAHSREGSKEWARLDMLLQQYPGLKIHPITGKLYRRLQRRFEGQINSNPALAGWETSKNNFKKGLMLSAFQQRRDLEIKEQEKREKIAAGVYRLKDDERFLLGSIQHTFYAQGRVKVAGEILTTSEFLKRSFGVFIDEVRDRTIVRIITGIRRKSDDLESLFNQLRDKLAGLTLERDIFIASNDARTFQIIEPFITIQDERTLSKYLELPFGVYKRFI